MSAAAVATLVLIGLLVGAIAGYLVWVILILRRIVDTLGNVTGGVQAIAHRTEPIGALVGEVNDDLAAVADAVEALAGRLQRSRDQTAVG